VDSLWKHTNWRLKEVIVVDDGSNPPLAKALPRRLLDNPRVRLLRHNKTLGLIAAKKTGGDAALSDIIVFFDCHVNPRDGWEEAFVKQMRRAGDHRTVVVPTITSLNPDTWEEESGAHSKACYILWNADFTWLTNPGRDVPLMSGGLLALTRKWWYETGGYDEHMVAWGGENIDQSLRAWLCGGRIEVAEGAYVAHMWRVASNPKTQLHYPIPTEDVMRNKGRAVKAWFSEFSEKSFTFPEYRTFVDGEQPLGTFDNFDKLKERQKCAPFSSYIQRFSYVYVDGGLIPPEIFQIREEVTGLCLERLPGEDSSIGAVMAPCSGRRKEPLFSFGNKGPRKGAL
jgi:glycosyltransferase involved in cell wall biosynthesis